MEEKKSGRVEALLRRIRVDDAVTFARHLSRFCASGQEGLAGIHPRSSHVSGNVPGPSGHTLSKRRWLQRPP
ncbi:hypothetical protein K0M31_014951 [Melipona bicolor]|uniref:Uncharacterized protein n=1 Tax=Melipona bicolor TaxID=60889 RepID=A0AA40FGK5_9HYME|nr:hypothetical protein K0M31_014951 [Melipona bicolor]